MRRDEPDIDPFSLFMERHPQQGHRVLELNGEEQDLPDSAIGELQSMGIVFVGQDENKETIAFIPQELLARLDREM